MILTEKIKIPLHASLVIRGILILLVVIDHNNFTMFFGKTYFKPLTLHVYGFFLISFLSIASDTKKPLEFLTTRLIRYLWPFFIFYSLYSAAYFSSLGVHDLMSFFAVAQKFFLGLVVGSFNLVKQGCGGAFMWFLPAFFGFSIIAKSYFYFAKYRFGLFFVFCVVYFLPAYVLQKFGNLIPFGILLAIYILPLLIISFWFLKYRRRFFDRNQAATIFVLLTLEALLYKCLLADGEQIEMGALLLPTLFDGLKFFIFISSIVCFTLLVYMVSQVIGSRFGFLALLGKHSLAIYLFHHIFLHLFYRLFVFFDFRFDLLQNQILVAIVSTVLALILSLAVSIAINSSSVARNAIFPKDANFLFFRNVFKKNNRV